MKKVRLFFSNKQLFSLKKLLLPLFVFLFTSTLAWAQSQAPSFIKVSGMVMDEESEETISARINYKKLPYYDDMGTLRSDSEKGSFLIYMHNNTEYEVYVVAEGYVPLSTTITINDEDGDGEFDQNFILTPEGGDKIIKLENLLFSRSSANISKSSFAELDDLANYLNARPTLMIQLEGHTDFAGNADANMRLSQDRVDAVKDYLTKKGVVQNRIKTKAFGGDQPLYTERTDEAKRKNRRVEVRILKE